MPKVPESTPQISTNVPGVQAPQAYQYGQVGRALEGVGANVERTGSDIFTQIKYAQASNEAANAYADDKVQSENLIQQLKIKSPDGFIHEDINDPNSPIVKNPGTEENRTIVDEFHSLTDQRFQANQSKMGSMLAQEMYKQRAMPMYSDQMAMLQTDAYSMNVKKFRQDARTRVDKAGDQEGNLPQFQPAQDENGLIPKNPQTGLPLNSSVDMSNFYGDTKATWETNFANMGRVQNGAEADAERKDLGQRLSEYKSRSILAEVELAKKQGLTTKNQDIMAALDVYKGLDKESQERQAAGLPIFSTMLNPDQKEKAIYKLESMLGTAKASDAEDTKRAMRDLTEGLKVSKRSPTDIAPLTARLIELNKDGNHVHAGEVIDLTSEALKAVYIGSANSSTGWLTDPDKLGPQLEKGAKDVDAMMEKLGHEQLSTPYAGIFGGETQKQWQSEIGQEFIASRKAQNARDPFYGAAQSVAADSSKRVKSIDMSNLNRAFSSPQNIQAIHDHIDNTETYQKIAMPNQVGDQRAGGLEKDHSKMIFNQIMGNSVAPGMKPMSQDSLVKAIPQMARALDYRGRDYFSAWIDQMKKDNDGPASLDLLKLHARDNQPDALQDIIAAVQDRGETEKVFKARDGKFTDAQQAVRDNPKWKAYFDTQTAGDQQGRGNAKALAELSDAAEKLTMMNSNRRGISVDNMKDAASVAYNEILGQHVSIVQSNKVSTIPFTNRINPLWGADKGAYILPHQIGNRYIAPQDEELIRLNMNDYLGAGNLAKRDIWIPKDPMGHLTQFGNDFVPMLSGDASTKNALVPKYVTTPEPGFVFYYNEGKNGQGVQRLVKSNSSKGQAPFFEPAATFLKPRGAEAPKPLPFFGGP